MQSPVFDPPRLLALYVLRVDGNTGHGAHLNALRLVKMTDALRAFGRVDLIDLFAQINRLVRALGLTHITVDALIGDHQCHVLDSAKVSIVLICKLSTTRIIPKKRRAVRAVGSLLAQHQAFGSMRLKCP
jgi:hypothetical protein